MVCCQIALAFLSSSTEISPDEGWLALPQATKNNTVPNNMSTFRFITRPFKQQI
jgi:hypothetical protein